MTNFGFPALTAALAIVLAVTVIRARRFRHFMEMRLSLVTAALRQAREELHRLKIGGR